MITPEQEREIVDRITKQFADEGRILEGGWQAFLAVSMPANANELQKSEMRKAYFLGAQHLFASIMNMLDPGTEPTERDLKRMDLILKELQQFVEQLKSTKRN